MTETNFENNLIAEMLKKVLTNLEAQPLRLFLLKLQRKFLAESRVQSLEEFLIDVFLVEHKLTYLLVEFLVIS